MSPQITYRGTDRNGVARTGRVSVENLPEWVARRFRNGWITLTVHSADDPYPVAEINNVTGPRGWWSS